MTYLLARALHIILACCLLLSSAGLLINQHFCGDQLIHSALFAKARSCHAPAMPACPHHPPTPAEEDTPRAGFSDACCSDQALFIKAVQVDQQLSAAPMPPPPLAALAATLPVYAQPNHSFTYQMAWPYRPPPLTFARSVRFQVFRL